MGRKRLFDDKKKWCNKCKDWLPLGAFGDNKRTTSGKSHYCKTCHNAYCGTFWTKVSAYERMLADVGMSAGDYLEQWRKQNKMCAICEASLVLYHRSTQVHARRLLCVDCAQGLGLFKGSAALLAKASEYCNDLTDAVDQEQHQPVSDEASGKHRAANNH